MNSPTTSRGRRVVDHATRRVTQWWRTVYRVVTVAGPERDTALLLAKAALATVLAWQFAVRVLHTHTPFYAPMAALLVVDRTMVRSVGASVQRLGAVVVGMSTAWLVGSLVGVHWWSMLPVMMLALVIGRWRRLGDHGIQVPAMVLLSLLTVGGTNTDFTLVTIGETLAGGVIGVLTNAVVLAPLHIRGPREQILALTRQAGDLLTRISEGLRAGWDVEEAKDWYATSGQIVEQAPAVIEEIAVGRESTKLNPRDNVLGLDPDWAGYEQAVETIRRAQWQIAGIARTLVDAADERELHPAPSQAFLEAYAEVLDSIRAALRHFGLADDDERAAVERHTSTATQQLADLSTRVRESRLDNPDAWPAYGALLVEARRLVAELESMKSTAVVPTDSGPIRRPSQSQLGPVEPAAPMGPRP